MSAPIPLRQDFDVSQLRSRLNGHNQLPKIILGIKFTDGMEVVRSQSQIAAA